MRVSNEILFIHVIAVHFFLSGAKKLWTKHYIDKNDIATRSIDVF